MYYSFGHNITNVCQCTPHTQTVLQDQWPVIVQVTYTCNCSMNHNDILRFSRNPNAHMEGIYFKQITNEFE